MDKPLDTPCVTLIYGDGIGPEVLTSAKKIIEATGLDIHWIECEAGEKSYRKGVSTGVPHDTIESIKNTGLVLKGPLTTPVGYGEKSANVTLRKLFDTYANIRPVKEFPGIQTPFSGRNLDMVVVRENVEDVYAGIEHMQTPNAAQTLKLMTRTGCEKILRFAFEYARSENRKKIHCATKANIMKKTEGLMKSIFESVASDYPDITAKHIIVDNCAHQLVRYPEQFDVLVTSNMNGDILSDLASGLVGGLGFAPGANIGQNAAIFEAVHGSAPDIAGKNSVNPTAMILTSLMMLRYMKAFETANRIEQALLTTLAIDGTCTQDVSHAKRKVSTSDFTDAIIDNLGRPYPDWKTRQYKAFQKPQISTPDIIEDRRVKGIDVFIEDLSSCEDIACTLEHSVQNTPFFLKTIASRGVQVYPHPGIVPDTDDLWQCRFLLKDPSSHATDEQILPLLHIICQKYAWTHVEKLHYINGADAFSKSQGED